MKDAFGRRMDQREKILVGQQHYATVPHKPHDCPFPLNPLVGPHLDGPKGSSIKLLTTRVFSCYNRDKKISVES